MRRRDGTLPPAGLRLVAERRSSLLLLLVIFNNLVHTDMSVLALAAGICCHGVCDCVIGRQGRADRRRSGPALAADRVCPQTITALATPFRRYQVSNW